MAIDNRLQVFNEQDEPVDYDILASDVKFLPDGKDLPTKLDEMQQEIDDAGGYTPPQGGIPKTDLSQSVQDTLDDVANKANSSEVVKGIKKSDGTPLNPDPNGVITLPAAQNVDLDDYATKEYVDNKATAELFELGAEGVSVGVIGNTLIFSATNSTAQTAAPTITSVIQNDGTALVTITAASGATISYSLDDGTTWLTYTGPITISDIGTTIVTAKAQVNGEFPSNTATATVTIESAGNVTIAKGTDDDSVQQVTFTATASDQTATVTISIGQQTQSGTGSASLSVVKTNDVQHIEVTATAAVANKVTVTETEQFVVNALPNTLLQGKSTAPITDIYIGSKHYTNAANTTDDNMVIDNTTVDGVNVWTLNFGANNITSLIRGDNGQVDVSGSMKNANIFGDVAYDNSTSNTTVTEINKIPDCVTALGKYCFAWLANLVKLEHYERVTNFAQGCLSKCTNLHQGIIAGSHVVELNLSYSGVTSIEGNTGIKLGSNIFSNCASLKYVKFPNSTGTTAGGCFSSCFALRWIEFGDQVNQLVKATIANLESSNYDVKVIVIRVADPSLITLSGTDIPFSNLNNANIYVPDASVNTYKAADRWSLIAEKIKSIDDLPDFQTIINS